MDYKEVVKKDGAILIFCDFEDLLCEAYGVSSMSEVEGFANSNNEYICHCPFCKEEGHTKHKLYVKTDLTVGHCFVCCRNFVNVQDRGTDINIDYMVPDFLGMYGGYQGFSLEKLNDPLWTVDKYTTEFDDYDETGYNYLINRNAYLEYLYKTLGMKFWNSNVVIPFYFNNEVFYYQIRFTSANKIKYFLPPIAKKPPYIIERNDEKAKHKILIVEGIFDAVAALIQCPEYTPVAVLGSSISDYQMDFIRNYCGYVEEVRIWMDETKISIGIAEKVKRVIDYCPLSIIKSYGPDPEEILGERIKRGLPVQWIKSKINNN